MSHAFARGQAGFAFPARLAEVLGVHERMLGHLALELLDVGFLPELIAQYEAAAAIRRADPECPRTNAVADGVIVLTGEASSAAARAGITRSAQGSSAANMVSNQMTVKKPAGPSAHPPSASV